MRFLLALNIDVRKFIEAADHIVKARSSYLESAWLVEYMKRNRGLFLSEENCELSVVKLLISLRVLCSLES